MGEVREKKQEGKRTKSKEAKRKHACMKPEHPPHSDARTATAHVQNKMKNESRWFPPSFTKSGRTLGFHAASRCWSSQKGPSSFATGGKIMIDTTAGTAAPVPCLTEFLTRSEAQPPTRMPPRPRGP